MLRELSIKNFKPWRDTGKIRLAPITVFFGGNSSGKTSILQFLLMLRQTAESPDRHRVFHPGDDNTQVKLGTFRDLIFGHDLSREIEFDLSWNLPASLTVTDPLTSKVSEGDNIEFSAAVGSDTKGAQQYVRRLEYSLGQGLSVEMERLEADEELNGYYQLRAENYDLVLTRKAWLPPSPVRFYGFPDEVAAYYKNAGFTSDFALELEEQLKRIQYLGPLRIYPARSYVWSGETPEHVGWRGERAVEAMLAAADRSISCGSNRRKDRFQELIARSLTELGLLHSFEVRPIAPHRQEYEVMVRVSGTESLVNLPDVGFGVSQVLPVLVQCFYAKPHTTLILEQPEIHLHPRVQTGLADLFVEAVQSREDGADRSIQLIVESHSEHFLRRLQRRVAEGRIKSDDVALYFCEMRQGEAVLNPLRVNEFGDIENWPTDFFGDEMGELAARMEAAAHREADDK